MELAINETHFFYEKIVNDFKEGKFLAKEHLDKINSIFNPFANNDYIQTYKDRTKHLTKRNYKVYDEIIYVKGKDIQENEHVFIVRAINLTYKGKKIIVINNDIVYIPNNYKILGLDYIKSEVGKIIRKNRRNQLFSILKNRSKFKIIPILKEAVTLKLNN